LADKSDKCWLSVGMGPMAKTQKVKAVYVIFGQEEHLKAEALGKLRQQLIGQDDPSLAESRYDGSSAELAAVLDDLRTLPFLTQRRVVIVEDADKFVSQHRRALERYVENPSDTGVLVLVCRSWPGNTRLARLVKKTGEAIEAQPLKGQGLVRWVINRAAEEGKIMRQQTAAMLVETIGGDLGRLASEVEKLSIFCAGRKEITPQDVETLCGITAEQSIFRMNDLLAEGKLSQALTVLNRLLQQDRSAQYTVIGAITWALRRLLLARSMLDAGYSSSQVLASAGVRDYRDLADRFMRQVRSTSTQKLRDMLDQLVEADLGAKTGIGTVQRNLERFIVRSSVSR